MSRFQPLPNKSYSIIYADPPYDYMGQQQHAGAGSTQRSAANRHYETIPLADLKELPVGSIAAEDCLLFLWITSPHVPQGISLAKSWGFDYATCAFVWEKMKTNPGYYTLSQFEMCYVFKRGKIPQPRGARNIRQHVRVPRGRHSEKPEEVRHRIEAMFPDQAKIELFARRPADGWDVWGNQIETTGEEE